MIRPVLVAAAAIAGFAADGVRVLVAGSTAAVEVWSVAGAELRRAAILPTGRPLGYLAWAQDGTRLIGCAASRAGHEVLSFAWDPAGPSLRLVGQAPSGGQHPCHVSVHPSQRWVFAANHNSGHVAMLPLAADGSLGPPRSVAVAGTRAHMAVTDRAGRFLYVPTLGIDRVQVYAIDAEAGTLTHLPAAVGACPEGSGPRHMAFSADERFAYVINELASSITRFVRDPANGALGDPRTVAVLPDGYHGTHTAAHILLGEGDRTVIASLRGPDRLVIAGRDPADGTLGGLRHVVTGRTPRHFALLPGATAAITAGQGDDSLHLWRIDADAWIPVAAVRSVSKPQCVLPAPR